MVVSREIVFLIVIIALSTGISFLGYRYLLLANEYRERNFGHLDTTYRAIKTLRAAPIATIETIDAVTDLVAQGHADAVWCIENLNLVDRIFFLRLGGGDALQLCQDAIDAGEALLIDLDRLYAELAVPPETGRPSVHLTFPVLEQVQKLLVKSQRIHPFVNDIQNKLVVVVKAGTVLSSLLLAVLAAGVAWRLSRARNALSRHAMTDGLTGLANRRRLDAGLAARLGDAAPVLMRIDLDRFKQVNDILGHEAGDFVLKHVADLMRRHAHAGDLLARVGGDEFVILCAPETDVEGARWQAEALLRDILEPLNFQDKQCLFGASFGIANATGPEMTGSELLSAADRALYQAKAAGRGTVVVYTPAMHMAAKRERRMADQFGCALTKGRIIPFFQTQHCAQTWDLAGVEVLARWEHPDFGLLRPDQFLGIAKQLGMEAALDAVIFERALAAAEDLSARGATLPRLAFNVSAARLTDPNFVNVASTTIPRNRENFAFEILESVSYEQYGDVVSATVDALKALGFQIDVDDFGSGHASINSVLAIAPDTLKLDRALLDGLGKSANARRMVSSIIEFAKSLGVQIIAEGVDSEAKAEILRDMGCDVLQGFYFSKPMALPDLEAFLKNPPRRDALGERQAAMRGKS